MAVTTRAQMGLGVDIGGSGIKSAVVDLATGELAGDRVRIPTPTDATPEAVADLVARVVSQVLSAGPDLSDDAPLGVTFPAVVQHGIARSAANVSQAWIDTDVDSLMTTATGRDVHVVNDADAAGVAEVRYGAAKGVDGLVILTTLGTGIGSAVILDGALVPNTELGHLEVDGYDAETRASDAARERDGLDWEEWAKRLQRYYSHVEALLWPDLFVVGGGVSKKHERFLPLVQIRTPLVPAQLRNQAGIVGAAVLATELLR